MKSELLVDAILFDMDGVLLDSRPVVERTWRRWAARHRVPVEPILRVAHGRRTWDTLREAVPELATREEVDWLDAAELEDFDGIRPIPGARELLQALPAARWTIVTSAGRELAARRLAAVGLELPDSAVSSEAITRGKPAPDGYQLAASRLGANPQACLVVEDAPPGIQAGKSAGARVLALTTTHAAEQLGRADLILPDLTSVRVLAGQSRLSGICIVTELSSFPHS